VLPASDVPESVELDGPDARPLVLLRVAPGEDRPKPDADEPTEGPVSVPVAGRGDSVDVLDEPMLLEGAGAESGRRPGGHGF
jgi:hypothetical protein